MQKSFKFAALSDYQWQGKIAVLRTDFNVPLDDDNAITDDTRIRASLPTLRWLIQQGAAVVCLSHLGRPKEGEVNPNLSLRPIHQSLLKLLNQSQRPSIPVSFKETFPPQSKKPAAGEIWLMENTRFNDGEKQNSPVLAKRYADLGDIFVMDAFATAHRQEASICAIANIMPSCGGLLLQSEILALTTALQNPAKPLVIVVGGAKISTKLSTLKRLLPMCDTLIVGGGIANNFIKADSLPIGASLIEPSLIEDAKVLLRQHKTKITAIDDVVVMDNDGQTRTVSPKDIRPAERIFDVGEKTQKRNAAIIANAGTIIWSGPVGVFEKPPFAGGTKSLAQEIAASSAYSLAGGGDTLAAIAKFSIGNIPNGISHLSTGGGAFLQFLEGHSLPALQALITDKFMNTLA